MRSDDVDCISLAMDKAKLCALVNKVMNLPVLDQLGAHHFLKKDPTLWSTLDIVLTPSLAEQSAELNRAVI